MLENWLNPSTTPVEEGEESELVEELEAPKPVAKKAPVTELPWDEDETPAPAPKAKPAPKVAAPKDDVATAFDDLFNS